MQIQHCKKLKHGCHIILCIAELQIVAKLTSLYELQQEISNRVCVCISYKLHVNDAPQLKTDHAAVTLTFSSHLFTFTSSKPAVTLKCPRKALQIFEVAQ